MKRWLSLAAIAVLCLSLVIGIACGGGGEEEEEGVKEVKLGWAEGMTGLIGAIVGIPVKQGVELAVEKIGEFEVAGERYRWNVIFEDNHYTSEGGVATATKFIYEDEVTFVHMGGYDSAMAAQTLCEEAGVLYDMSGAGMEAYGPDNPHTIQTAVMFMLHTPAFFKWLSEEHPEIKTIAMTDEDDAIGHARTDAQVKAAEHFGFEVVLTDFYPVETAEFYPLATRVMAQDPDFFVGYWDIVKALQEMGYEGLSAVVLWMTFTGEVVGHENFQGHLCYSPLSFGEGLPQSVVEFAEDYEARYGAPCEVTAFYAAHIMYVLTDILRQAGTVDDIDKILATIDTGTFDTVVFGPMRFGGEELCGLNRVMLWPIQVHEWWGEQPRVVFTMDAEEAYDLALEIFGE